MFHLQPGDRGAPVGRNSHDFKRVLHRPLKMRLPLLCPGIEQCARCPDTASSPSICAHLRALQCGHANATFAISVWPPAPQWSLAEVFIQEARWYPRSRKWYNVSERILV